MNCRSNIVFCIWSVILHMISMQLVVTFACNTYSDFCDNSFDNSFVNVERMNKTNEYESEDEKTDYVDDILNRAIRSFKPYRSEKELSLQITTILDELLFESGYDRQIRPQLEGPPLEVSNC